MKTKGIIALGAAAILLVAATAGASVYIMDNKAEEQVSQAETTKVSTRENRIVTQAQPVQQVQRAPAPVPVCDDDNIVGKVVGGAAGGLAGSQIGGGSGKTAATIGGAVGGTLLGEEYIPTRNVTCR